MKLPDDIIHLSNPATVQDIVLWCKESAAKMRAGGTAVPDETKAQMEHFVADYRETPWKIDHLETFCLLMAFLPPEPSMVESGYALMHKFRLLLVQVPEPLWHRLVVDMRKQTIHCVNALGEPVQVWPAPANVG
jgi:hypothetical protein